MAPMMQTFKHLMTEHGNINVQDSIPANNDPDNPIIVLLHGNSFCLKIWRHVFESELAKTHRIIALEKHRESNIDAVSLEIFATDAPTLIEAPSFKMSLTDATWTSDLFSVSYPGHGDSSDANDPETSYNMPAYADAVLQAIDHLSASQKLVVIGWSLGGHVAIEMAMRTPRVKGIMITGTPPCGDPSDISEAFTFGCPWREALAARDVFTDEEVHAFAHNCADPPYEDWMLDCVKRTDGRSRKLMFEYAGEGKSQPDSLQYKADTKLAVNRSQKSFVELSDLPVAVVNGIKEPFINLAFIRAIKFKNLWKGQCIEMEDCYHAPFWGKPKEYQELLEEFVKDVS